MKPLASLQGRLLALLITVVAATWLAAALVSVREVRHEIDELLDGHLAQAAALLIAQQALGDEDDRAIDAPVLHRYAPRVAFQVWHEGRMVLRSANAPEGPLARHASGFVSVRHGDGNWRVFAARGAEQDITVYVGESIDARAEILHAVLRGMVAPLAVALPAIALLAWWAVRSGLFPLRELARQLRARAPDSVQPVQLSHTPTELQAVTRALDGVFERLARVLDGERRFTADAAHELRTPIAAIAAQAQVALAAEEDAVRRGALERTVAGCERAARLVDQMLTLARLEQGAAPARERFDLAALARRVCAELLPQAGRRAQSLELDAPDTCPWDGDELLTGVLLRNLVDNALRYGRDGGAVRVRLSPGWRLEVEDDGPGMADAERQRLGERFFRVPGHDASGSGLGWSIVRRIAQVQQLQVDVAPGEGGRGLRVGVQSATASR